MPMINKQRNVNNLFGVWGACSSTLRILSVVATLYYERKQNNCYTVKLLVCCAWGAYIWLWNRTIRWHHLHCHWWVLNSRPWDNRPCTMRGLHNRHCEAARSCVESTICHWYYAQHVRIFTYCFSNNSKINIAK